MPPKCLEMPCDLQHGALEALGPQKLRQRQAFVNLAPGHRGGFFRRGPPAPAQRGPDADQPARRIQHEGDEDQPEPEQPVRRPDRKQLAKQDEEQRAERRPQHVAHAADHDDRQQFAGERHRHRFRRNQIILEPGQRAGEPGHHGRDHEHPELVALDRIALEGGAQLVLADRHQHVAERRAHDAKQHVENGEPDQRDDDVIGQRIVEIERPDAAALQAAEAVLAAGDVAPAERDRIAERGQRQRQQREVDAAAAQDDDADDGRGDRDEHHRQQQRQPDIAAKPVELHQSRGIGADAEPGAVAERHQPGVADAEIEAHRRDRQRHHHDAGVEREPERLQAERQRDQCKGCQ